MALSPVALGPIRSGFSGSSWENMSLGPFQGAPAPSLLGMSGYLQGTVAMFLCLLRTVDEGLIAPGKDSLEEEMATYRSILAWETPWTAEPGGL